jgi:uncharacterized damage-inducible protein DinB
MRQSDVLTLFDHLYWIRDRILAAADQPGVAVTDDAPSTIRDLRATLVHELDVQWSWRERLRAPDPTNFSEDDEELKPVNFPTVAAIRDRWSADEVQMRSWIASLSDAELDGPCRAERNRSHPLWYHLQHVYTHGLQQFADAATLLSGVGHSPGEIDFLEFVDDRERSGSATP